MARTWLNYPCTFYTKNTVNGNGDSKYVVKSYRVTRDAPINRERAPSQVHNQDGAIAYLSKDGNLLEHVAEQKSVANITVASVDGDRIFMSVNRGPMGPLICECSRKPANGLIQFDFNNDAGVLKRIHLGHEVHSLSLEEED